MNNMRRLGIVAGLAALMISSARAEEPLFSFGIVADVQYADQHTTIGRDYRQSLVKLTECTASLNQERLAFVIQLGDLVDKGVGNLNTILNVYDQIRVPKYHVLGNHDFCTDRATVLKKFGMSEAYYQFSTNAWRFVVLDGMNESVSGGWAREDPHAVAGRNALERLRAGGAENAQTWNGAVGSEQREWLRGILREAGKRHERVIVFCHMPVLPESSRPGYVLWDYREVLGILESGPSVAVYMNGHYHEGGYAVQNGIHFLTFPAMVEHDTNQSCRVADVYPASIVVRQAGGAQTGRVLNLR